MLLGSNGRAAWCVEDGGGTATRNEWKRWPMVWDLAETLIFEWPAPKKRPERENSLFNSDGNSRHLGLPGVFYWHLRGASFQCRLRLSPPF